METQTPTQPSAPSRSSQIGHSVVLWAGAIVRWLPTLIFKTVEALTVLGIFFVMLYMGYWLVFGDVSDPRHSRMLELLRAISDNWKAGLILLVPLLFRTVRTFMEEVQEFGGAKRRGSLPGPGTEAKNPPSPPGP